VLELDVADDPAARQVVAMGVELGAEDLDVEHAAPPERAQRVADEDMLDDPLAQGGVEEVGAGRR
jgi:hypothetical protein